MTDTHCWHADPDSPASFEPWPSRAGRQGVACCVCPARGHRSVTLPFVAGAAFDSVPLFPIYGDVTQTRGFASCSGADLRDKKYAMWIVNGIGYAVGLVLVVLVAIFLPSTLVELFRVQHIGWLLLAIGASAMVQGFLAAGHKELRRVKAALAMSRAGDMVAFAKETALGTTPSGKLVPSAKPARPFAIGLPEFVANVAGRPPRLVASCPLCLKEPVGVIDTDTAACVEASGDRIDSQHRWRYYGVKCSGPCGFTYTLEAVQGDNAYAVTSVDPTGNDVARKDGARSPSPD